MLHDAFLQHFQHSNIMVHLQSQIRLLHMDQEGVQRYADQFLRLANRLNWPLEGENTVFQFKAGLSRWMLDQLSIAEANDELVATATGMKNCTLSVDSLVNMALKIEANK